MMRIKNLKPTKMVSTVKKFSILKATFSKGKRLFLFYSQLHLDKACDSCKCSTILSGSRLPVVFRKYVYSLRNVEKDRSPVYVDTEKIDKMINNANTFGKASALHSLMLFNASVSVL